MFFRVKPMDTDFVNEYNKKIMEQIHDSINKQKAIEELEELRADTWNQDKITRIQEILRGTSEEKE